jgi:serine/threonine-protein kinase
VDGWSLAQLIKRARGVEQRVPWAQSIFVAAQLCRALEHAHGFRRDGRPLNIVHRDLSPQNVLVSAEGEVKLTDFGIARSTSHMQLTEAGMIKGKPGYLAPEQASGTDFDARVDLFALGVTLWECLSGEPLFTSPDLQTMLRNVFDKQVPPLRTKRPEVPAALEAFVMQLLQRDLTRRTPSARVALQSLRAMDMGAAGSGAGALAAAVELTLRSTTSSAVDLKVPPKTPSEAVTLPGRT